ncbi:MAG: glycosyltransferase family 2 protein [Bryobacteraceae bacterium]
MTAIVAIPTLAADEALAECLKALAGQTLKDFQTIVIDNSGGEVTAKYCHPPEVVVISNGANMGFGYAVNQAIRDSSSKYVVVLNDDTIPAPDFLERLIAAADKRYEIGMCAPKIVLAGENRLDSAGMVLARDGSSKQRGHLEPVTKYNSQGEVLLASGCACLYRRDMLDEIGLFDESYFLYCEDTDLGLRARWAAWECAYVPDAVVEHRYSHSAGRASAMKAFYVERNRLYTIFKTFPLSMLLVAPFFALARYFWHLVAMLRGTGKAAQFRSAGGSPARLPWIVVRAHFAAFACLPRLLRQRKQIKRRLSPKQFARLCSYFRISVREVASH